MGIGDYYNILASTDGSFNVTDATTNYFSINPKKLKHCRVDHDNKKITIIDEDYYYVIRETIFFRLLHL